MAKRMRQFMGPLYGENMNKRFIGWQFLPVSGGLACGQLSDHWLDGEELCWGNRWLAEK